MTRRTLPALAAVAILALLTGCTAQPGPVPGGGTTAQPASEQRFACPAVAEVAALTAIPFSERTAGPAACTYTTASDVDPASTVTVRRPGSTTGSGGALAARRDAAIGRGEATEDIRDLAFDAFTASNGRGCTAWFPAVDGRTTAVTANRSGAARATTCGLASAVATLIGSGAPSTPIVSVLASGRLLGASTAGARWPWRIGRESGVRIDRLADADLLRSGPSTPAAVAKVPADSAAVVFVSGTGERSGTRLARLRAATTAIAAAAAKAPKAQLIVVGPVADGTTSSTDLAALRSDLSAAADIAGARYLDPATGALTGTPGARLDAVADGIVQELRDARVTAR